MSAAPGPGMGLLTEIGFRMADAAAQVTLRHFRSGGLGVDNKDAAGFDPVTAADRGAEIAMRDVLSLERPLDGVFGEEQDQTPTRSGLTWVLDPIDGTRAFISGLPVWGTLIALDDGSRGRIGIIDQPYIGERFVGVPDPSDPVAELHRFGTVTPIRTRPCSALSDATVFTTDPYLFTGAEIPAFDQIRAESRLTRFGTDCYAYALLASGHVDLVVESGLAAYDIAAHIPLIQAAGGVVTDWQGGDCRWGGRTVAAGDPAVHEAALRILSDVD